MCLSVPFATSMVSALPFGLGGRELLPASARALGSTPFLVGCERALTFDWPPLLDVRAVFIVRSSALSGASSGTGVGGRFRPISRARLSSICLRVATIQGCLSSFLADMRRFGSF